MRLILMSVIAFIAYCTAQKHPPLNSSTSSGSSSSDSSSSPYSSSSSSSSSNSGSGNSSSTSSSPSSSSSSSNSYGNRREIRLQQNKLKPIAESPQSLRIFTISRKISRIINQKTAHISSLIDKRFKKKRLIRIVPNYNEDKTGNIVGNIVGNMGTGNIAQINNNNEGFASYRDLIDSSLKSFHVTAKVDNVFAQLTNTFGQNGVLQKQNGNDNSNLISNIVSHKNGKSAVLFTAVNTVGQDYLASGKFKIKQLANNDSAKNIITNK